jgi:serine protease SohB
MIFLTDYLLFLLKTITYVIAILGTVAGIIGIILKTRLSDKDKLTVKKLNEYYQNITDHLNQVILSKKQYKQHKKQKAAQAKQHIPEKRIFVLDFQGDMKASALNGLREAITAIIQTATPKDEVLLRLESPGGLVSHYGLAASQLARLKEYNICLTVSVDKIAASGGYLMACVANRIIAAPFAIVGSIGVVTQFPNFNRFLKKHNIDFESLTAGEYKRTLTLFGENTEQDREKMKMQLEEVHNLFKQFIREHRPQVDVSQVATGEHWLAKQAIDLQLVDQLTTSDDYLLRACSQADIYHVKYAGPKLNFKEKLGLYLYQGQHNTIF